MLRLTADLLLHAYAQGIFPMARSRDSKVLDWIDPDPRGILPLETFHLPRSLGKALRKAPFDVRVDTAFRAVMEGCAEPGPDREDTWINPQIADLFVTLHDRGLTHCVECWRGDRLVGGLYGLALGGAFFGESMFSRETDASKIALVHLVALLKSAGFTLLDTQFVTAHLARFGACEIPRREYQRRLRAALATPVSFPSHLVPWSDALRPAP